MTGDQPEWQFVSVGSPREETLAFTPRRDGARGFLTEADRSYLRGESDIEPKSNSERHVRQRIRDRTVHALIDFSLVFGGLEERDREQLFGNPNRDPELTMAARNGAVDAIALIYELMEAEDDSQLYDFEAALREAIGAVEMGPDVLNFDAVDVDLEVDTSGVVEMGAVADKIGARDFDTLSEEEIDAIELIAEISDDLDYVTRERLLRLASDLREEFLEDEDSESDG
jgi:hypothetical protein